MSMTASQMWEKAARLWTAAADAEEDRRTEDAATYRSAAALVEQAAEAREARGAA